MPLESYFNFILQSTIVTALPGPTMLLVIHYALQYGKQAIRFTAPGILVGDMIALAAAFMGLGALLKVSPNLFATLKIAGGTYLITLGVAAIRSKEPIKENQESFHKPPGRRIFTHMMFITAFNPQNIVFLLAFFPQFINPEDDYFEQFAIMGIIYSMVAIILAIIFNSMAHKIATWIKNPRNKKYISWTSGSLLCAIGVATIFL